MSIAYGDDQEAVLDEETDFADAETSEADEFADTDVLESEEFTDTAVYQDDSAVDEFIGESSVVFDVDDIVAEFEAESVGEASDESQSSRLRKRLEAIAERKRRHNDLMDFGDYDLDG